MMVIVLQNVLQASEWQQNYIAIGLKGTGRDFSTTRRSRSPGTISERITSHFPSFSQSADVPLQSIQYLETYGSCGIELFKGKKAFGMSIGIRSDEYLTLFGKSHES
jgi:hypothetical protein